MEKVNTFLQMETYIEDLSIKEWGMGKEVINGKMKVVIKGNGLKIKCMGLECM